MNTPMWYLMGAVRRWRLRRKGLTAVEKAKKQATVPSKEWVQTRNFLYYDGTVMPEIKEDLHEQ